MVAMRPTLPWEICSDVSGKLPRMATFSFLKVKPMPKANIQGEGRITEAQLDFTISSCFNSTTFEQRAQKYEVGEEKGLP